MGTTENGNVFFAFKQTENATLHIGLAVLDVMTYYKNIPGCSEP